MTDLAAFREAVTDWATRLDAEYFAFGSGQKPDLVLAPIYADHAAWFTADRLQEWETRWSQSREPEAHPFRRALLWTAEGYLDAAVEALTTQIAEAEAGLTITWDGEDMPLYSALLVLAGEPSVDRRRALDDRCGAALETLEPLQEARLRARHAAVRAAGYASYRALHERVLGLEFGGLHGRVSRLLAATEATYEAQLDAFLTTHAGTSLADGHTSDAPFLMAYTVPGFAFPADGLTAALDRTLTNLGLAPLAELPITLDLEPRPTKHPRAFCCGIDIPHDVRLSHAPVGGIEDYTVTFHEMGHALHFAHARDTLPPEDRYLGDHALTEAYAFLMEDFLANPYWLSDTLGIDHPGPLIAHAKLTKTYLLRRYIAKLGYEMQLHALPADGPLGDIRRAYAEGLSAATALRTDGRAALRDVDDGFYCAHYLRAWCVDAQIRQRLVTQFGPRWFQDRAVGAMLRSWWAEGSRWSVDDLAAAAGVGVVRPDALIAELTGDTDG